MVFRLQRHGFVLASAKNPVLQVGTAFGCYTNFLTRRLMLYFQPRLSISLLLVKGNLEMSSNEKRGRGTPHIVVRSPHVHSRTEQAEADELRVPHPVGKLPFTTINPYGWPSSRSPNKMVDSVGLPRAKAKVPPSLGHSPCLPAAQQCSALMWPELL